MTVLLLIPQMQSTLLGNKESYGQKAKCALAPKENYICVQPAQFIDLWGKQPAMQWNALVYGTWEEPMEKSPDSHEYCIGTLLLGEMKSEGDYIIAKKEWGQWRKAEFLCCICWSGSDNLLKFSFSSLVQPVIKQWQESGYRGRVLPKSETQTHVFCFSKCVLSPFHLTAMLS